MDVKLRAVVRKSFQQSEATNFAEWAAENPVMAKALRDTDAVCFVNYVGDQLCFVYGFKSWEDADQSKRVALVSQRVRLTSGTWSERMIADYGAAVGLNIVGHKRFADYFKEEQERKRLG